MGARMSTKKEIRVVDWVSFLTFLRLFIRYCFILRGLLVAQAALVILLGAVFAWCEKLPVRTGNLLCDHYIYNSRVRRYRSEDRPRPMHRRCNRLCRHHSIWPRDRCRTKAFTVTIEEHLRALGDAGPTS